MPTEVPVGSVHLHVKRIPDMRSTSQVKVAMGLAQRCHPNWSNDSYSKIFLRINVGPKQISSDNCLKKEIKQICQNNFKFDIYSKKIYLLP